MKKRFGNKLAFTLVELVVVIAILGILSSVAGISIAAAVKQTKRKQAQTSVRTYYETCNGVMAELNGGFSMIDLNNLAGTIAQRTKERPVNVVYLDDGESADTFCPARGSTQGYYVFYRYCDPAIYDHVHNHTPNEFSYFMDTVYLLQDGVLYTMSRYLADPQVTEL